MGWIHGGEDWDQPDGGPPEEPIVIARRSLLYWFEEAARSLFGRWGIIPPAQPSRYEARETHWFVVFTFRGEYHSIPKLAELRQVLAGTLQVCVAKRQWRTMDPLTADERQALEWILQHLEDLQRRYDAADRLGQEEVEAVEAVSNHFKAVAAEHRAAEKELFNSYPCLADSEVIRETSQLTHGSKESERRLRPTGEVVTWEGRICIQGRTLWVRFERGPKGPQAVFPQLSGKIVLVPQRPWTPEQGVEYRIGFERAIGQYGNVWLVRPLAQRPVS